MKISKEIRTGFISVVAIGLLIAGVNFLKGNSFFGGDDIYYGYFPNSGGIAPASSVIVNGVPVGKVLSVEYNPQGGPDQRVKIAFNIQIDEIKIPVGSEIKIGSIDLFSKGIILTLSSDYSKGYHKPGSKIHGVVAQDMMQQVQAYADPITKNLQSLMSNVDKAIVSLSAFWDTTATSELEESMREVKIAIKRLGNVAVEVEYLVQTEKIQLNRIFDNVENITGNLKRSNDQITSIIGNTKKITDDMLTADFKGVIGDAQKTIKTLNVALEDASQGKSTLGLLLKDDKLYHELVNTNKKVQDLVDDLTLHPERYIHFSVLGAKTKGVPLTTSEEKKLRMLLDSIH